MNEVTDVESGSPIALWWIVAAVAVVVLAGCASSPGGLDSAQIAEATAAADERSETLAELVPAETKVLAQIRPGELLMAMGRLSDDALTPTDFDDEVWEVIDHIDTERPVVVAVATTGNEELIERAWLHGMATDIGELATGVHLRALLPTTDTTNLVEELAPVCAEDGGRWVCRSDVRGEYVTVDFLFDAPESAQRAFFDELETGADSSNSELFERRTPALQQFLNTDAPVATYWTGHGILDALFVTSSTLLRTEWNLFTDARSAARNLDQLLWSHGHLLTSLRADPRAAEFEDFAVVADIVELDTSDEDGGESSPPESGFQIDVLRTYTERGRQVWHPGDDNDESSVIDRVMQNSAPPRWAEDDAQALIYWLDELASRRIHVMEWLYPVLEAPGGLIKSARNDDEVYQWFEERFSGLEFELTPQDSRAVWRARVSSSALADSPLRRLTNHLEAGAVQLQASSYRHMTYEATRLRLAPPDSPWQEPPLVAFDEDTLDPVEPPQPWRGCMGPERSALSHKLAALEVSVPEQRGNILAEMTKMGQTGIERCSRDYPGHSERYQSALGSWYSWKALRNSAFYNFYQALRYAEVGCDHGVEPACAQRESLDAIDDFSMPPFGHHWDIGAMLPGVEAKIDTFLISKRGLFADLDGKPNGVVEVDELDDSPEEAVASLLEELDGDAVQLVPDAMTDAALVATVVDAFADHGVTTGLVAMSGGAFSDTAVLESDVSRDDDSPSFGLHLTAEGIIFFGIDGAVPPIDGCPVNGPTFCVTPEGEPAPKLFERARKRWSTGDIEEAAKIIDSVLDRYRFYEMYNLIDYELSMAPAGVGLHVSVEEGLPAVAAFRLLTTLAHQRSGVPFDDGRDFRTAHIEIEHEHRQPRPLFEYIRLRAERVSAPDSGDGLASAPEDSPADASALSALGIADPPSDDAPASERPDDLSPELETDPPQTQGALDREIIQRVVRQNRRDIQHCYETRLYDDPELEGKLTVVWVIAPSGDVLSTKIKESTLDDEELHRCVAGRIQRWVFPEPDGGGIVRVNYPFSFSH